MKKLREEIDEEINKDVESLRNTYDTLRLTETAEFTRDKLMIPYLNGQAGICQSTLQVPSITEEQRYLTMRKLIAYQTCSLEYIDLEEEELEYDPPPVQQPAPPSNISEASNEEGGVA